MDKKPHPPNYNSEILDVYNCYPCYLLVFLKNIVWDKYVFFCAFIADIY